MRLARFLFVCVLVLNSASFVTASESGLPLLGAEAEHFLRVAHVVAREPIGVGITKPVRLTLRSGDQTHDAVWKTVDEVRHGVHRTREGRVQAGFRDSYRYEVAAYELDKLLGLGLVPPTVVRTIGGKTGSVQLWVNGAFTELDRRERGIGTGADARVWSDQQYRLRLLHALTYNSDSANIRNVLYDEHLRVYAIDNSRSFRRVHSLRNPVGLRRFSREVLLRLRSLARRELDEALAEWLTREEIEPLLVRRDLILQHAERLAAEHGDDVVLYW